MVDFYQALQGIKTLFYDLNINIQRIIVGLVTIITNIIGCFIGLGFIILATAFPFFTIVPLTLIIAWFLGLLFV